MTILAFCGIGLLGCALVCIGVFADWWDALYERAVAA